MENTETFYFNFAWSIFGKKNVYKKYRDIFGRVTVPSGPDAKQAAMDKIATALEREFNTYIDAQTDDESFDDALCREEENLLCGLGVPYFEDDKPENKEQVKE